MRKPLMDRIRDCPTLPSLPPAALEVLKLTQANDVRFEDIARAISGDPALATRLLRMVNSSFYGHSQSITTIHHAVTFLGLQSIKTLVIGLSLMHHLGAVKPKGFQHLAYWRRSLYAATAASTFAGKLLGAHHETAFTMGLLMDLGMLVLDRVLGDEYGDVCSRAANHAELPAIEHRMLGLTHGAAVGILAESWELPSLLAIPMAQHHDPEQVTDEPERGLTDIAYLASVCADVFVDPEPAMSIAQVRQFCAQRYRLRDIDTDSILCHVSMKVQEAAPFLQIKIDPAATYEKILQEAHAQLIALTLAGLGDSSGKEKRRMPRSKRDNEIAILPCSAGIIGEPVRTHLRDVSSTGLGLRHAVPLPVGSQFVVQLPQKEGKAVFVMYTVVRCEPATGGKYDVGVSLECILNPKDVAKRTVNGKGALARVSAAVLQ